MSESFQKILFEPYTQEDRIRTMKAQNTGSGLGLAIVKKLATLMNGTITVQSQINQGSTFTLTLHLPYITREDYQKENKETVSEDTVSLQGKRILVCEDNEINQEIVQSILSRYQMQADIAPNGIIGRNLFEKSAPGYYYAVLMDLRMPMMDGYDTAQSIRTMAREDAGTIPIIAMTADVFSEDIAHCLAAGMNDHLAKPLEPGVLYEKLKKYQ
jgi:FOG: CheY-like receiver